MGQYHRGMNDTEMLDWLQKNGEAIYTVQINGTGYLVLEWNDENGETQCTYGCDLRDAIRGAVVGENVLPGLQHLVTAN